MNILALPIDQPKSENVYFLDIKKNMLMEGIFTKMIYINEWFTMNGLYIHLPIEIQSIYMLNNYHKKTIYFSISQHSYILHQIDILEQMILDQYTPMDKNKQKIHLIGQSFKLGYFRIYREQNDNSPDIKNKNGFILKISGIWENVKGYGLSYKIMDAYQK